MNYREIRNYWKSEDYINAREVITDSRKRLGIYKESTRMSEEQALMVHQDLVRQGDNVVADYVKELYYLEV